MGTQVLRGGVKCLLLKYEALTSDPQHPFKAEHSGTCLYPQYLGEGQTAGSHGLTSQAGLDKAVTLSFSETVSKIRVEK